MKAYQALIANLRKDIQDKRDEKAKRVNEAIARQSAEAKKPTTDDKLDLILKKLDSLEKRIGNPEKKETSRGGTER